MGRIREVLQHYRGNKAVWAALIVLLLLTMEFFFGVSKPFFHSENSARPVVAFVLSLEHDVRHKPFEDESWFKGEADAEILKGDALYTGLKSAATVEMMSGGQIAMGEETLVVFDDVDGVIIPDVTRGQVRLQVNGEMRIAISGEMTEISGLDSQLALSVDAKTGARIESLKGKLKIKRGTDTRQVAVGARTEFPAPEKPRSTVAPPSVALLKLESIFTKRKVDERPPEKTVERPPEPVVAKVEPTPAPTPVPTPRPNPQIAQLDRSYVKTLRLPDLYVRTGKKRLARRDNPSAVKLKVPLRLDNVADEEPVTVEVARDPGFTAVVEKVEAKGPQVVIGKWAVGKNHIRVSRPGRSPSDLSSDPTVRSASLDVRLQTRPGAEPMITPMASQVEIVGREVELKLRLADPQLEKPAGFVIEGSRDRTFAADKTKSVFVKDARLDIPVTRDGVYYFRSRSVASNGEISTLSGVTPIRVYRRQVPTAPVLSSRTMTVTEGETTQLSWRGDGLADKYNVSVLNRDGKVLRSGQLRKESLRLTPKKAGEYDLLVQSISHAGKRSAPSRAKLIVKSKPVVTRRVAAVKDDVDSADATNRAKKKNDIRATEEKIRPWYIAVEGAESAYLSTETLDRGIEPAGLAMIGLVLGHRDRSQWASLGIRTKAFGTNAPGGEVGSFRAEGKYTRWWQLPWSPFRGPISLGLVTGLENRQTPNNGQFSSGYSLAKLGLGVWLNFSNDWHTGGEILYGRWIDSNQAYEVNGFLSYDLSAALNFGIGYRLSLFDAGTQDSAPVELPYREAFGEAYSNLRFAF